MYRILKISSVRRKHFLRPPFRLPASEPIYSEPLPIQAGHSGAVTRRWAACRRPTKTLAGAQVEFAFEAIAHRDVEYGRGTRTLILL